MSRPTCILTCLATLAAVGCQDKPVRVVSKAKPAPTAEWSIFRGDPSLRGIAPGQLSSKPELAWKFETKDAVTSSPVVVNGTVFVGSGDGFVYAVDLASGKEIWKFKTDDLVEAPPLVHKGHVYVGSADFFLYALDAVSGKLLWKFETGDKILGSANWMRDVNGKTRILVGSYDNKLYCFDQDGKKLWDYTTDNYVNGTPAILADRVVFGGCDAVLHVVSATKGKAIMKLRLGDDCHVAGSVALADGKAFFGHYGNEFVCVDLDEGKQVWSYPSRQYAFFSSPAVLADRVVFGGRNKKVHCVRRDNGKQIWTFPTKRKVDGSPVVCGDKVVVGSGDGRLYLLALADGKDLWNYEIGRPIVSSPAVAQGMIVVGANDNRLWAFRAAPKAGKRQGE